MTTESYVISNNPKAIESLEELDSFAEKVGKETGYPKEIIYFLLGAMTYEYTNATLSSRGFK